MKIGAKLSIDSNWDEMKRISKLYDFVEVFGRPTLEFEKKYLEITNYLSLHSSHHIFGVDLSKGFGSNIEISERNILFASQLDIKIVVIHAGSFPKDRSIDKTNLFENTVSNLKRLNDLAKKNGVRLLIENLPLFLDSNSFLFGSTQEETEEIMKRTGCGLCFDFSHAAHSSYSQKTDFKKEVDKFMELNPELFHLYDTPTKQDIDLHVPFGQGSLDIPYCLSIIGNGSVTLEIVPPNLDGFTFSLKYVKQLLSKK